MAVIGFVYLSCVTEEDRPCLSGSSTAVSVQRIYLRGLGGGVVPYEPRSDSYCMYVVASRRVSTPKWLTLPRVWFVGYGCLLLFYHSHVVRWSCSAVRCFLRGAVKCSRERVRVVALIANMWYGGCC